MRFLLIVCMAVILASFRSSDGPALWSAQGISDATTLKKLEKPRKKLKGDLVRNTTFSPGEELSYRIQYAFITAGEANLVVGDKLEEVDGRSCYNINVEGKSSGLLSLTLRVRDTWRTYMDTASLYPQKFYRKIEEGKYRLTETSYFNRPDSVVRVESFKKEKDPLKVKEYGITPQVHDIISGYYYLRNIDYKGMHPGDRVSMDAFFEDTFYDLDIEFLGKEKIRTKFGKMKVIKLAPVMPNNSLFSGKSSIRVWLSDDENKIPVKVEADMFVGAVEIELRDTKNLLHPMNSTK